MDTIANQVCSHAGGDALISGDSADSILNISREYCAPDASDHVNQQIAKLLQFKNTEPTMDMFLVEFDIPRRTAESRVPVGTALLDALVPVLRMQNALSSRTEKSLLLASGQGTLSFPAVAKQLRRLSGPSGGAARQDV